MLKKDEILRKMPESSGIYMMKGRNGQILYIGKAKVLKSRVRSYFQKEEGLPPRTKIMLKKAVDVDFVTTSSEIEALMLESNFIKMHQPRYNVLLKDDKHYPFIRLSTDIDFPYLSIVRKVKKDGAAYFGPYVMVKEVRETLRLIHKIFPFRQSRDELDGKFKRRPCLNYQMERCAAPCAGKISKEDYNKIVQDAVLFLKGRNDSLLEYLEKRMSKASEELRFEEAAKVRDQIKAVESVIRKQKISSTNLENQDVVVFCREGCAANAQILLIRNGEMVGNRNYKFTKLEDIDDEELISSFIKQYYADEPFLPEEILLSKNIMEMEVISRWLSAKKGKKLVIQAPEKGRKKNLVRMAEENARFALKKDESGLEILEELKESLALNNIPIRIEAFDISNISGSMSVGALALFIQGEPFKKGYRRFKIRDIEGADDYGMIRQVILRHYSRLLEEKKELPQLLIIDGGKGHLNAAVRTLKDLDLIGKIDVISIAKGKNRSALETDEIYTLKQKVPVSFPVGSPTKFLIQRIRDEVHRFAITYHRKLRKKGGLYSILDDINGIGGKRKKQLIKHFGGITKLKKASVDEIKKTPYITEKIAIEIKTRIQSRL